ncbi:MAG: sugar phosphate isomerase/epimerase family protein [Verrucomicrobiia bacterium]
MKAASQLSRRDFLTRTTLAAGSALMFGSSRSVPMAAEQGASNGWQIGCYTRPFDKFDWRTAFDGIAEAGYKYAGLVSSNAKQWIMIRVDTPSEDAAEMGAEAKKRGLQLISAYGDFSVANSLSEGISGLQKLIDNCVAAQCPNLLLGGASDPKHYAPYFKAVRECCAYADEKGVGLSIKPHGGQNATGPQCRKAIQLVGHPRFRLWYDPGNIFYYSNGELDPVTDAASVDGLVVGMSVKDYRHPKDVMVTPGTGKVDFPAVFAALKKGGFTSGPVLVECLEQGPLTHVIEQARKTRVYLEELLNAKA